ERRRGDPDPGDHLSVFRDLWLDFDGDALTFRDRIEGRLRASSRLEMPAPAVLGRAEVNGRDWFLTRLAPDGPVGVEVPPGAVSVRADGRIPRDWMLRAIGWGRDVDALSATLHLPPGWRLLHVSGADRATPTWLGAWWGDLLRIFLALVGAAAVARLFGAGFGALALAAFVLTWSEPGAPLWTWLAALAAE